MKTTVLELWREQISRMLPAAEDEEDDGVDNEGKSFLSDFVPANVVQLCYSIHSPNSLRSFQA